MSGDAPAAPRGPVCLIVNPSAAGGRALRALPAVEQVLRERGLTVHSSLTTSLQHARELAARAVAAGETAVAFGGDGVIGAVADELRHHDGALLGVLPGGRGNDLVRALGIPREPRAAAAVIADGVPRAIDLGEVDGRTFLSIASAGLDSDANRIANEAPRRLGSMVYGYGALRALASWHPATLTVQVDPPYGEQVSLSGYTIAVANSSTYGGGMRIAPDAVLDDGRLDVILVGHVGRLRFLANLPRVFKGTHVEMAEVRVLRGAEVLLSADRPFTLYADGDPIAQLPARVRVLPAAVRVLVPAAPAA